MLDERFRGDLLAGHDLVLTPNLRTARFLESLRAAASSSSAERFPTVLPWRAWTTAQWQKLIVEGAEDRVLLNETQAAVLWQQVLQEVGPATLRPVRSLVDLCMGAHRLVWQHGAAERVCAEPAGTETDTEVFVLCLSEFERHCEAERLLSSAALESELARQHGDAFAAMTGRSCLLYGFDRLTPAQEELVASLRHGGVTVERTAAEDATLNSRDTQSQTPPTLLRCDSPEDEFRQLAQTMRDLLQAGSHRIAVVLPRPGEQRGKLERELRETLLAGIQEPLQWERQPIWEFSEGVPLGSVAVARDALSLLAWLHSSQSPEDVSQVLRSPYFDFGLSAEQAAHLDARMLRERDRVRPEWSLAELARATRSAAPRLHSTLLELQEHTRGAARKRRSFAGWTDEVREVLRLAGWPGKRERGSVEYQAVDRWHDLLDELASIDMVASQVLWSDFLQTLRHMAASTLFSPENTDAPIQIMSPSESAGSIADVLWFACADETQWNASQTTNPLLAYGIQKEFCMPGTDAERDAAHAFAVTQRLARSAAHATFSYAAANESGPLRPSALVARLPNVVLESAEPSTSEIPAVELEELVDDAALPPLPDTTVSGGVSILQHQAACAFRAFAERRLFASEVETTDLGMEARERGSALHLALQYFWEAVKTQSELKRHQAAGTLEAELVRVVDEALPAIADHDAWTSSYLNIQRERLLTLLRRWMEYELSRPDFEVVHTEREVKDVAIGPLRMNVRVDRIDRVKDADGEAMVLIDYKTGEPDVKGWMGERPDQPQLPLYATAAGVENVQAIAFASVRPGRAKLGLHAFPPKSPLLFAAGKEESETAFEEQLVPWHETLERLAGEFAAGVAEVGPKEYPATCQYCAQRMLCRLNPELLEDLAEEETEAAL